MDRNTIIGFALILLLVIGYTYFTLPSQQQLQQDRVQDSLALVAQQQHVADSLQQLHQPPAAATSAPPNSSVAQTIFHDTSARQEKFYTIENELMKVTISSKGGEVVSVELKKYKTSDQRPLELFDSTQAHFNYIFFSSNNQIQTGDIGFTPVGNSFSVSGNDSNTIVFRASASKNSYIEQRYTLKGNSYFLGYNFYVSHADSLIQGNNNYINLSWNERLNHLEQDIASERRYSTVYFKNTNDDADEISAGSPGTKSAQGPLQWITFKQHFFNATLIPSKPFDQGNFTTTYQTTDPFVADMKADLILNYDKSQKDLNFPMRFYFAPNNYYQLKDMNIGLEQIIPLGYGIFATIAAPITKYFILPSFRILSSFISNYGMIILIMTLVLRLFLLPLTYRSFRSAAKMRVLQPEMQVLREKYKNDQAALGQEQMKLFRQAGVNPLGGCIPLLLQLPVLAAMYSFFPQSIELRQQSFLWTKDLSTYDSILNFGFSIPFLGDHLSLWTLLMTAVSIFMAVYNNQFTGATAQMKWMTYVTPIFLLGIFNSQPAAMTYYWTISNLITLLFQFLIREFFIDEEAIHRQMQENKKKPKKKSGFQQRLEDMMKQQQLQKGKK